MSENEQENEKHEMIADIVKEMRECDGHRAYYDGGLHHESGEESVVDVDYLHDFADRIEAAWKLERSKVEADALEVGGIVEASRTAENSSAVGNEAAMRDALLNIQEYAAAMDVDDGNVLAILDACRDALAAPARNCDRYDNKTEAETAFVEETGADDRSPHYWQMFANWLFWKNDRKGENDGR